MRTEIDGVGEKFPHFQDDAPSVSHYIYVYLFVWRLKDLWGDTKIFQT